MSALRLHHKAESDDQQRRLHGGDGFLEVALPLARRCVARGTLINADSDRATSGRDMELRYQFDVAFEELQRLQMGTPAPGKSRAHFYLSSFGASPSWFAIRLEQAPGKRCPRDEHCHPPIGRRSLQRATLRWAKVTASQKKGTA